MPKISIILPSYNHAPYIKEAINSVIKQTFSDFELLISDDASTDESVKYIRECNDPRIKLHTFSKNQGSTINVCFLLGECQGEYVALINSDDVWLPQRLEKGVAYLDAHPECGAVFSWADLIDEKSQVIMENCDVFSQPNRSQAEWLRYFYTRSNCLCHPSMLIRRSVYDRIGRYCLGMRQLPDFDMWIRLVKHYDIHIFQEVLVQHRRFVSTGQNESAPIPDNSVRNVNESLYILMHFFDDMSDDLFVAAFRGYFRNKNAQTPLQLICEKYFLMLDEHYFIGKIHLMAAMYYFLEHCNRLDVLEILEHDYGYSLADFYKIGTELDILGIRAAQAKAPKADPMLAKFSWIKRKLGNTVVYSIARKIYHRIKIN